MLGRHGLEGCIKTSSSKRQENGIKLGEVNFCLTKMPGVEKVRFKGLGPLQPVKGKCYKQGLRTPRRVRKKKGSTWYGRVL